MENVDVGFNGNQYSRSSDSSFVRAVMDAVADMPRENIHFCYLVTIRHRPSSYTAMGYANNPRAVVRRQCLRRAKLPKGVPTRGRLAAIIGPFHTKKRCKEVVTRWKEATSTEAARIQRARELAQQNNVLCWDMQVC